MFVKNIVDASTEQRNIEKSQLHINSMFFVGVGITSVFLHDSFLISILCAWALGSSWYMVVHNKMDFYRRAFATVLFVHIIFAFLPSLVTTFLSGFLRCSSKLNGFIIPFICPFHP